MNYIEFDFMGEHIKGFLEVAKYCNNGNLAIQIYHESEDGYDECWCDMTTNLGCKLEHSCAYVNSNADTDLKEIINRYKLGKLTGKSMRSGFNIYEEYEFDMKEVMKYTKEDESEV